MSKLIKDMVTTELRGRYGDFDSALWVEFLGVNGLPGWGEEPPKENCHEAAEEKRYPPRAGALCGNSHDLIPGTEAE